jgi:hypothetical protein
VTLEQVPALRKYEGRWISLSLIDGSRIDECQLISVGRHRNGTLWVYSNGDDQFIALSDIVDYWAA